MPRPAIRCGWGLLKHDETFDGVTMRHVRPVEGENPADVVWRCCSESGIYCGESLDTPHLPVPEPTLSLALALGVAWMGAAAVLGPVLGKMLKRAGDRYPDPPNETTPTDPPSI